MDFPIRHFYQERLPALARIDHGFFRPRTPVVSGTLDCKPVVAFVGLDGISGRRPERVDRQQIPVFKNEKFRTSVVTCDRTALASGSIVIVLEKAALVCPSENVTSECIECIHTVVVGTRRRTALPHEHVSSVRQPLDAGVCRRFGQCRIVIVLSHRGFHLHQIRPGFLGSVVTDSTLRSIEHRERSEIQGGAAFFLFETERNLADGACSKVQCLVIFE